MGMMECHLLARFCLTGALLGEAITCVCFLFVESRQCSARADVACVPVELKASGEEGY